MSDSVFYSQPGYILHQRPYRESSLIIDTLTRDCGRISLLAKGVRKAKSKTAGMLRPFISLSLSYTGKSDLRILTGIESVGLPKELKGVALLCGFYLNELICNFLHKDDPHPEVFEEYQECLSRLFQSQHYEAALRQFELNLMEAIGYGLDLGYDLRAGQPINPDKVYRFDKELGMVEDAKGMFLGSTLQAINQRQLEDPRTLKEAKTLMRAVIDGRLQGKQLKSRVVINNIVKRL